jgi:hypothetical protein
VIDGLDGPHVDLLTPEQLRELVEPRTADSHKGDFGRVTVIAGSMGKTGAAFLAGMGALRSGAGLVTVATPASCLPIVASMAPELMTESLAEAGGSLAAAALDRVLDLQHDIVACGPGLGRTNEASAFVRGLVDRGAVSWDLTLGEGWGNEHMHAAWRDVTLTDLLRHRAGAPVDANAFQALASLDGTKPPDEHRALVTSTVLAKKPLHPPGSKYLYSNLGYVVAAAVLERATGKPWETSKSRSRLTEKF